MYRVDKKNVAAAGLPLKSSAVACQHTNRDGDGTGAKRKANKKVTVFGRAVNFYVHSKMAEPAKAPPSSAAAVDVGLDSDIVH